MRRPKRDSTCTQKSFLVPRLQLGPGCARCGKERAQSVRCPRKKGVGRHGIGGDEQPARTQRRCGGNGQKKIKLAFSLSAPPLAGTRLFRKRHVSNQKLGRVRLGPPAGRPARAARPGRPAVCPHCDRPALCPLSQGQSQGGGGRPVCRCVVESVSGHRKAKTQARGRRRGPQLRLVF
jgi:hypothetical protein